MKILRRFLGVLVMIAGILGLILSIAGLVGLWMVRPTVAGYVTSTIDTLNASITTSQEVMGVTKKALGATVDSVDALSVMLASTAASVEETIPALESANTLLGENLPDTLNAASDSLKSAEQAAMVLDSSIKSLETFQILMSSVPMVGSFVQAPTQTYNPDKPLAESLGDVAVQLEGLPPMFIAISEDMGKADDNLESVHESLTTMSVSVKVISQSLSEYETMIAQSQASMGNLAPILTNIQTNLDPIVNGAALALTLFLLWLLAIQVVVFSQGWELYQGTAGRMEGGPVPQPVEVVVEPPAEPAEPSDG
jgi:hypothetical protein